MDWRDRAAAAAGNLFTSLKGEYPKNGLGRYRAGLGRYLGVGGYVLLAETIFVAADFCYVRHAHIHNSAPPILLVHFC